MNKEKVYEQLEKILKDNSFSRSKIYPRLLKFLVISSLENKELREVVIGSELYGKSYDPVKYDNKVRVYVHHLRKKLEDYYKNKAGKDEIVFFIEKGQYNVKFSRDIALYDVKNKKRIIYGVTITIILVIASLFFFNNNDKNLFWEDTLQNGLPVTVLFGDLFTIQGSIITGGNGVTRDFHINSEYDFNQYLKKNPGKAADLSPGDINYITRLAPYCSKTISYYFCKHDQEVNVKLISEWDKSNIQTENIVYFGQTKNMRMLKNVLIETFPQYSFKDMYISRKDTNKDSVTIYSDLESKDKIEDYTLVVKLKSPSGNSMHFFLSDQDCGAINAIQYFTNNDSIQQFYNRHKIKDRDFIALFKATCWERKGYKMDFVLIDFKE